MNAQDAVVDGLALPWSSGVVENQVTRIKLIKRRHTAVPHSHCCGSGMVRYLCPRLDEWLESEEIRPGRLQHLVSDVQRRLVDARSTA